MAKEMKKKREKNCQTKVKKKTTIYLEVNTNLPSASKRISAIFLCFTILIILQPNLTEFKKKQKGIISIPSGKRFPSLFLFFFLHLRCHQPPLIYSLPLLAVTRQDVTPKKVSLGIYSCCLHNAKLFERIEHSGIR